jgi:hypothetical protein
MLQTTESQAADDYFDFLRSADELAGHVCLDAKSGEVNFKLDEPSLLHPYTQPVSEKRKGKDTL